MTINDRVVTAMPNASLARNAEFATNNTRLYLVNRLITSGRAPNEILGQLQAERRKLMKLVPIGQPRRPDKNGDYIRTLPRTESSLDLPLAFQAPFRPGSEAAFGLGYDGLVQIPPAAEGISVTPQDAGASGGIFTYELYDWGGITYVAGVEDGAGTDPAGVVWLTIWRQIALLPPPPTDSIVQFRVAIDVDTFMFSECDDGTQMVYVSVGRASRYDPSKEIPIEQQVGWALIQNVNDPPLNGRYGRVYGGLWVYGQMRVPALTVSAVGLLYGAALIVRNGRLEVSWGNITPAYPIKPGILTDEERRASLGKVYYRITPEVVLAPPE